MDTLKLPVLHFTQQGLKPAISCRNKAWMSPSDAIMTTGNCN